MNDKCRTFPVAPLSKPITTEFEPLVDAMTAAKFLNLHPVTLREFARAGRIPGIQIGRAWRFRLSTLDAWITEQEQKRCYHSATPGGENEAKVQGPKRRCVSRSAL